MIQILVVSSHVSSARVLSKLIVKLLSETQIKIIFVGNRLTVERLSKEIRHSAISRLQIFELNSSPTLKTCMEILKPFDDVSAVVFGVYLSNNSLEEKFAQICEVSIPQILLLNDKVIMDKFLVRPKNLIIASNREIFTYAIENYQSTKIILSDCLDFPSPSLHSFNRVRKKFKESINANDRFLTCLFLQVNHMTEYEKTIMTFMDTYCTQHVNSTSHLLLIRPHPSEPLVPSFMQKHFNLHSESFLVISADVDVQEVLISCDLPVAINSQCLEEYIIISRVQSLTRYKPIYLLMSDKFRQEKERKDKQWYPDSIISGSADCASNKNELSKLLSQPNILDFGSLTSGSKPVREPSVDPVKYLETFLRR